LAFIVKGDINIDAEVEELAGFYLCDGTLNTGVSDNQFVGKGFFVGLTDVNLQRDFEDERNQTIPAEVFEYSPSLLMNAPEVLKKPSYTWKEVPG